MLVKFAILTGLAVRALSDEYVAVITGDFDLAQRMTGIGKVLGKHVWPCTPITSSKSSLIPLTSSIQVLVTLALISLTLGSYRYCRCGLFNQSETSQ